MNSVLPRLEVEEAEDALGQSQGTRRGSPLAYRDKEGGVAEPRDGLPSKRSEVHPRRLVLLSQTQSAKGDRIRRKDRDGMPAGGRPEFKCSDSNSSAGIDRSWVTL